MYMVVYVGGFLLSAKAEETQWQWKICCYRIFENEGKFKTAPAAFAKHNREMCDIERHQQSEIWHEKTEWSQHKWPTSTC